MKKRVKRVERVNLMKSISRVVVVLAFLTAMLGVEMQLVAQVYSHFGDPPPTKVNFSNPIMTTDCCPEYKGKIEEIINNAPFVFEGRFVKEGLSSKRSMHLEKGDSTNPAYSLYNGHVLYRSYLFEIEKVYRGGERLKAGTIEVIVTRSRFYDPITLYQGWYLLFAKEIDILGAFDVNNTVKLELYSDKYLLSSLFGDVYDIKIANQEVVAREFSHYMGFSSLNFRTKEDIRNFLVPYGLISTDMPKADTLKTLSREEIEEAKEEARRRQEEQEQINKYYKTPEQADSIRRELNRRRGFDLDSAIMKKRVMS